MADDIVSGADELGVLLLGHDLNGWWTGSQLDIKEARALVPHQNATTLQVAAAGLTDSFGMTLGWTVFSLLVLEREGLAGLGVVNAAMLIGVALSAPATA